MPFVSDLLRSLTHGGTVEGLKVALETTKQIITLSTGVITLTVTFLEKIVQPTTTGGRHIPGALKVGWICFGLAIGFAVWALMAITGSMNALDRRERGLTLNENQTRAVDGLTEAWNIRTPAFLMLFFFALGTALTIATGFWL